jgi:response regulator RpfG family c-di-GMP phosphodiesterase
MHLRSHESASSLPGKTAGGFRKVIVVDDTYVDRFIAERIMTKCGFAKEIILKECAESTLDYLVQCAKTQNEFPELIFLDIRMPKTDAFSFLDEFEKFPAGVRAHCSVILMTTLHAEEDEQRAKNYPSVKNIIQKPVDHEILVSLMSEEH